jgi:cytochrome oxidase Cu insertion factor (SCO1/SenC/PrrC family)
VIEGFKLPLEDGADSEHRILHSDRFVLVDRQGRIRGYYHGMTQRAPDGTVLPAEMEELVRDVKKLLAAESATQASSQ